MFLSVKMNENRGWKDILRDSRGNVAVFDFYGESASTIQNVGCLITMITQIGTSASANVDNFFY